MTEDQFKQLLEQNNVALLTRFDKHLDKRLEQNNATLMERIEASSAVFFGKLSRRMDTQTETLHAELAAATDRIYGTLDGITKRLDIDDQERSAVNAEQERQNGWIAQLAKATRTKLVPEQ